MGIFQAVHPYLPLHILNNHSQHLPSLHNSQKAAHTPEPGAAFCHTSINTIPTRRHVLHSQRAHQLRTSWVSKVFNLLPLHQSRVLGAFPISHKRPGDSSGCLTNPRRSDLGFSSTKQKRQPVRLPGEALPLLQV